MHPKCLSLLAALAIWGSASGIGAVNMEWKSNFTFYGDNTEFFEPFRTGETLLGQQGKTWLEAELGPKAFLLGGVFGDFRSVSVQDPSVAVKPILSFRFREGGTQLVMGTLEARNRHGFLEPLEATFLEFTRPVEYGLQWREDDAAFKCDFFLNWHQLNTPTQPESFDYGGVFQQPLDDRFTVEEQMHNFHDGGQLYYITVLNNWVPAVGFRWRIPDFLGETRISAFGVMSGFLAGGDSSQTKWGGGGYLKVSSAPGDGFEFFGIGWKGLDFYSQEGDANYGSYSDPDSTTVEQIHDFVKHDRTYVELGGRKEFLMEGGASFVSELRVHFIDESTAYSYRLAVYAPLDLLRIR